MARPRWDRWFLTTALVVGGVVLGTTVLVFLGLALTANPPGALTILWSQGRYFLPLLPLAALAAGRTPWRTPDWVRWFVPAGSVALLAWVAVRVHVLFYAP
jgi:hypothetical protein